MFGTGRTWLGVAAFAALLWTMAVQGAGAVSGVSMTGGGGAISLTGEVVDSEPPIQCRVTLSGTLATSLVRISGEGTQVGSVNSLRSSCAGEEPAYVIRATLNLPWPIRLKQLDGVNPRFVTITGLSGATLDVSGISIQMAPEFPISPTCLFGGSTAVLELTPGLTGGSRGVYGFTADEGILRLNASPAECVEWWGSSISAIYGLSALGSVWTFLAGGEVLEQLTPSPVEFGTVAPSGIAQRQVTISTTRGGRVESMTVTTGRYFAVTDPNGCRGTVMAQGSTCVVTVTVTAPAEAGRAMSDTLTVVIAGRRLAVTLRATT